MKNTFEVADGSKFTFCRDCRLHFVGVWDRVSSVGWIWDLLKLPYTAQNADMVNGRHAVSIDERRCYFRNNLWGDQLPGQSLKQVWFAGVHSDVGGSYAPAESGLSQIALEWMLCEAVSLGLMVDPEKADQVLAKAPLTTIPPPAPAPSDPAQKAHDSLTGAWWILEILPHSYYDPVASKAKWRIPLGARRVIPENSVLHQTVIEKLKLIQITDRRTYPRVRASSLETLAASLNEIIPTRTGTKTPGPAARAFRLAVSQRSRTNSTRTGCKRRGDTAPRAPSRTSRADASSDLHRLALARHSGP
jgi:Uncharacterized alpha/beta hydrolase domain (DUF2235)